MNTDQATNATPEAVCSTDMLGPLPEPYLHTAALAVMNAGWERCGPVYSADQMRAYALDAVVAMMSRRQCKKHDGCNYLAHCGMVCNKCGQVA